MTDTIPVSNEIMLRTAFWKTQSVHIAFLFLQAQSIHIVRFEKRNEFTLRFLKGTMWRLCFKKNQNVNALRFSKQQSWACSLFPGSLSAHFISMDPYRSSAHLAKFQVSGA